MPYPARAVVSLLLVGALLNAASTAALGSFYNLPPHPPAHQFGTSRLDRVSSTGGVQPVLFSHWQHRIRYTCTVCHTELEIEMEVGATGITEADNRAGRYCGACHDGSTAFAPEGACERCHSGDSDGQEEKFVAVFSKKPYPSTPFGNGIDWVETLRRGLIAPARYLWTETAEMPFDKELLLQAEMGRIPPAVFPHQAHSEWMGCDTCHPYIFNIKAKGTKHFRMSAILEGEFCGVCHLNVAFPMDDCARCHPGIGGH